MAEPTQSKPPAFNITQELMDLLHIPNGAEKRQEVTLSDVAPVLKTGGKGGYKGTVNTPGAAIDTSRQFNV